MEEAQKQGHDNLLTFGGAWSNHIYATAAAGKQAGLKTIGIIRGEENRPLNPTLSDAAEFGMELHYMDRSTYRRKNEAEVLAQLKEKFGKFYLVPEGGSNELALKGVREMVDWKEGEFSHICCPVGTGGTLAGMISAGRRSETYLGISSMKNNFSLEETVAQLTGDVDSSWSINHDYHFGGYAKVNQELMDFIRDFEESYQVPLDPIYTAKMIWGILDLISKNHFPAGSKILAIHTGGLQGRRGFD